MPVNLSLYYRVMYHDRYQDIYYDVIPNDCTVTGYLVCTKIYTMIFSRILVWLQIIKGGVFILFR